MFKRLMRTDILYFCQTGFFFWSWAQALACPSHWLSVQASTVALPGTMDSNQGRVKGQESLGQARALGVYSTPSFCFFFLIWEVLLA